ncbi:hypothetical protein D3C86_1498720 [compost metagenome]
MHRLFRDADFLGDKTLGSIGVVRRPLTCFTHRVQQRLHQIRTLPSELAIYREQTRRAVVDADRRVGMGSGFAENQRLKLMGDAQSLGAFDEKCVDLAFDQLGEFIGVRQASQQLLRITRRGVAQLRRAGGDIDKLHLIAGNPRNLQGREQAFERGGTLEIDNARRLARQAQALAAQLGHVADTGRRQGDDSLEFIDPCDADQPRIPAAGTGMDRWDVAALAKRPGLRMIEMAGADFLVRRALQRLQAHGLCRQRRL